MKTKVCTKCGVEKPLGDYYAHKSHKDGKRSACKECSTTAARRWKAANRTRVLAAKRKYYARKRKDPEYRKRAAERNAAWYQANKEDCILRTTLNRDIRGGA